MSVVPPVVPAPKFFSIESASFPGYNLTQRGTQLVLSASNKDNPFQLWYKDDSWQFLDGALVFINHGSKMALQAPRSGAKATLSAYDPAVENDTLLWSQIDDSGTGLMKLSPVILSNQALSLGVGSRTLANADGIPAIVTSTFTSSRNSFWKLVTYVPDSFRLQCSWYSQQVTYKTPHTDVTYVAALKHNDETSVVGINSGNNEGDRMLWYRIPAGGQEDTTFYSSFVIVNKGSGLALKGSSKPGDKVIATPYDPLDYDFVWSEDRNQRSVQEYVSINLSKVGATNLHWTLSTDDQYQNGSWYHPLTVLPGTKDGSFLDRQSWKFIPSNLN